jgi:hypothetical protein
MREEIRFIKVIKTILVVCAVVAFAITCYQAKSSFVKGYEDGRQTSVTSDTYHLPIIENTFIPGNDSLLFTGSDGSRFQLKTKYLVSGDVFNEHSPHKMFSFFKGFKMALGLAMLVFYILLLLKLYYFIDDSSKGKIFTLENINSIRVIGGYCISLSFISFVWDLCGYFITKELFSHTSFSTAYLFDFNYLLLIVGIVTMVIMHVFKKGYELQQEQELTV